MRTHSLKVIVRPSLSFRYNEGMTIKEILNWGAEELAPSSDSPRVDAELILGFVLKKSTTFLLAHNEQKICSIKAWLYRRLIRKRKQGIPVAYLVGHKEFYFLDFIVNRNVLVPRPDTETLVDCVISYLKSEIRNPKSEINSKSQIQNSKYSSSFEFRVSSFVLLDVGTGSGCIPISILKNVPGLRAMATDVSWRALRVAKKNARRLGVSDRIQFIWSDLLKDVRSDLFEDQEVIMTANLPYLPDKISVSPELTFEPSISLYGGSDGMNVYKRLFEQIQLIRPKAIFLELYEWQIALLGTRLLGYTIAWIKPMSGEARCLYLERSNERTK